MQHVSLSVSLIICSYNRPTRLRSAIEMAMAQQYHDYEVIAVDQTAMNPPDIQAYLDALPPERVRYTRRAVANLPAARNHALAIARGELLVFIDDDVQIPPTFIRQHVAAHQQGTQAERVPIGGVSGLALSPRYPTWESVVARMTAQGMGRDLQRGDSIPVPWLSGCNMSFPRTLVQAIGGFDPYFTGSAWGEDVDISLAVRAAGYRLLLDTRIELFHELATEGGGDSRATHRQQTKHYERTGFWLYLLCKHWRTLGLTDSLWRGWRLYRDYAGSLALYRREGFRVLLKRHQEFIELWGRAVVATTNRKRVH